MPPSLDRSSRSPAFLRGNGLAALIGGTDWASTPLGPMERWPSPLKTLVSVMLGSKQPMFVAWGAAQTLIYNDAYAEVLAAKHPAALGRPFLQVWSEVRADLEPIVEQAYAGEPVHMDDIELLMVRNGYPEETHFAFSYTPVFGEAGEVHGFFCACREITEQVLAERRRREETLRQRRLFEQAPGFIVILRGRNHVFEFVNEAYRQVFGQRDYLDREARAVFPELEGQGFFELLDQIWSTGERVVARDVVARLRTAGGAERELHLDFIYEPVRDEHGEMTGIFCEGHDVTEMRRAQEALSASEARFRTALQIKTVGAIYFDMDGRVTDANDAFLRMSGYSRAELQARVVTWQSLTPQEWLEDSARAFAELKARGETTPYEKEYLRKDGSRWWGLFAAKMLPDGAGFEFVLDITDRKRAEEHLKLLVLELNHRVKNNLATVQSIARQTLKAGVDPVAGREAFMDRLTALASAHDLLTVNEWQGVALADLIHGVLDPMAGDAHRLDLEGPPVLLSAKTAISLSMAFHELGTNALKYGALSQPSGRIRLWWTVDEGRPGRARLHWREAGGPLVTPPERRGFGSRLLERALAVDLGAPVEVRYAPGGVEADMQAPLMEPEAGETRTLGAPAAAAAAAP